MAMTATFNEWAQLSQPSDLVLRNLMSRIRKVSNNLTEEAIELANREITLKKAVSVLTNSVKTAWNSSREDKAWMGLTIAAGIGAKLAAFSALNIASGGTVTAALIGGAAVGVTKSLITSYRKSKKEDNLSFVSSFFSKKTLMTTVSSTALSAATFGALGAFESLTGVNIAEKIGQGLHHAFNYVANTTAQLGKTAGQLAFQHLPVGGDLQAATLKAPVVAQFATATPTSAPAAQPVTGRPAVTGSQQPQRVASVKPIVEPISTAYKTEYALKRLRDLLVEAGEVPEKNATALELAKQLYPDTKNPDSLVRALEGQAPKPALQPTTAQPAQAKAVLDAPKLDVRPPAQMTLPDGTVRDVQMPPLPDIHEEWGRAVDSLKRYEMDRMAREAYQIKFGTPAPADLKVFDIAKLTHPENTNQYLAGLIEKAEALATKALPPEKMRAACLSDLPATQESHQARGLILPNICSIGSDTPIQAGDYVTMRDVGEPIANPGKHGLWNGIRAVFAGAATSAHEFMDVAIGKIEINNMTHDKLAIDLR